MDIIDIAVGAHRTRCLEGATGIRWTVKRSAGAILGAFGGRFGFLQSLSYGGLQRLEQAERGNKMPNQGQQNQNLLISSP